MLIVVTVKSAGMMDMTSFIRSLQANKTLLRENATCLCTNYNVCVSHRQCMNCNSGVNVEIE